MKAAKDQLQKTLWFIMMVLLLFIVLQPGLRMADASAFEEPAYLLSSASKAAIAPETQTAINSLQSGEMLTVIVRLKSQADLSQIGGPNRQARINQLINVLQNQANATQNHLRALLELRKNEGLVGDYQSFWVFNGLVVTATAEVIEELAARPEIEAITPNEIDIIPTYLASGSVPEANISVVNAPALWDLGYRGQGIVVANMDSGVDYTHPDLNGRWRGGSNSWYDPYDEHPLVPTDLTGHGTWTMGALVGGDTSGAAIGVAPDAQWIAVKIFDDSGSATATAVHNGFQWLLDPDGNPSTPDTPHVVNNSWTNSSGGCDLEFELDLQALRAAGILPIFAAGNGGPSASSSRSPANNPSAFAVGATTDSDAISFESSRGPSACGEPETIFPEIVAPGFDIYTSDIFGLYTTVSGTSLAAPHAAGGLVLLMQAYPNLLVNEQEEALLNGVVDLGSVGPDNDYGYGRLDLLASYQWLEGNNNATPTPTPIPLENLALGKPVTVSSSQDGNHDGSQAVDGDNDTYWQTKIVRGKNGPTSESITVDLLGLAEIEEITISWHDNYATNYELELSSDGSNWTVAYVTASGDGSTDSIVLGGTSAQYVRMTSTGWSDSSLRNWVREIEVAGVVGSSMPTSTPPPTNTPAPTPTPSPTPAGSVTMHVGDLEGSTRSTGNNWRATVTITIHNSNEIPLANASVSGSWSSGYSGMVSCVTDGSGQCSFSTGKVDGQQTSVTFSVDTLSLAGYAYESSGNHDPDTDSDGTVISITAP